MNHNRSSLKRGLQVALLCGAVFAFLGAGDQAARFNELGHRMMCVCGCSQILLECNHVGCKYSDNMRGELMAALDRGDSDDLLLQSFVQKYGTTVIAAPTSTGFNRVAWVMPYLALVLGIVTVVLIVGAWNGRGGGGAAGGTGSGGGTGGTGGGPELERFREQARKETEE
jgi:cytochrome c-type biogenesis protein CcmH/NrfF